MTCRTTLKPVPDQNPIKKLPNFIECKHCGNWHMRSRECECQRKRPVQGRIMER